jgi:hypothetical protein
MDRNDADHAAVSDWIDEQDEEHVTTPLAVAGWTTPSRGSAAPGPQRPCEAT